jgi:hypothetical protein
MHKHRDKWLNLSPIRETGHSFETNVREEMKK